MIGPAFESVLVMARGGDEEAFATLWRHLNPAVVRYLRLAAPEAAEDLASETWLKIARTFGRFAGDERGFRVWVLTIARSRMLGWRRRMARRPAAPMAPEEFRSGWRSTTGLRSPSSPMPPAMRSPSSHSCRPIRPRW